MTTLTVSSLFDQWNTAIKTKDPAQVLELYAPNAVLLPTLSNTVCDTPEKITTYFNHFLAKGPEGKIDDSHTRHLGDIAIHSGIYTFTFSDQSSATARFTYVYQHVDNNWKIIEHHSSLLPEG